MFFFKIQFELTIKRFHDADRKNDELYILGNYLYKGKYKNMQ